MYRVLRVQYRIQGLGYIGCMVYVGYAGYNTVQILGYVGYGVPGSARSGFNVYRLIGFRFQSLG